MSLKKLSSLLTGKWKRVYLVIMSFYLFDFITTLRFCTNINEEGGDLPRLFMGITNNVFFGLLLNIFFMAILWGSGFFIMYRLDCYLRDTHLKIALFIEGTGFTFLGYFPARSFHAATSWFLDIPDNYRCIAGALIYYASLIWVKPLEARLKDLEYNSQVI